MLCNFKQKTAYELRISDWSSDVFSSDLDDPRKLAEHPHVDVVSVCVRVPAHRELVMLALEAGKHVYCEWPLGRDTDEAAELERFARERGVTHMEIGRAHV